MLRYVLFIFFCYVSMGCSTSPPAQDDAPQDTVRGVGTIRYLDLEGGFYGIIADDGERYDPGSLEEAFRQDGLRVRFEVKIRTDVFSLRMWGTPVQILAITPLARG